MNRRTFAILGIPFVAMLAGFAAPAPTEGTTHVRFEVPPGHQTLRITLNGAPPIEDLRFFFAGNAHSLRITRVFGTFCRAPDITFADATPREATAFFDANPILRADTHEFEIEVDNTSAVTLPLQVRATFTWTTLNPPCGL